MMIGLFVLYGHLYEPDSGVDCEEYTKSFNGGIRDFAGERYNISTCAAVYYGDDEMGIRLRVHDSQGILRVERHFHIFLESAYPPLIYSPSSITYPDYSVRGGQDLIIKMPPSHWDYLKVKMKYGFFNMLDFIFDKTPIEPIDIPPMNAR